MSNSASDSNLKEVLLVGSGAVGAIYAFVLKRSGLARVTAVARSNYDLIEKEGIHYHSAKYGIINGWRPDRLCKTVSEAADRAYSYVIITTKSIPEVVKSSTILAPLLSPEYTAKFPQPAYVFLQNGLNVEVDMYHALKGLGGVGGGEPRIIGCALYIFCNLLKPNVVEHADFDRLTVGVYRHGNTTRMENTPEEAALLADFSEIVKAGGVPVTVVPEVQRHKFNKNLWNISFSSFATLTQYTIPAIFRPPPTARSQSYSPYVCDTTANLIEEHTIPNIVALLEECVAVGRALGFPDTPDGLPSSVISTCIDNTRALHARPDNTHVSSMLLDLRQGRPLEVEVIVGEVVRMAKAHGVAVPRVEMLYALLLVVQNQILRQLESKKP